MHTAKAFFGKKQLPFTVAGRAGRAHLTRAYKRFTDVIDDTIDARVYLGIHFRAADVQGAGIGQGVAHWLDKHYFQRAKSELTALGRAAGSCGPPAAVSFNRAWFSSLVVSTPAEVLARAPSSAPREATLGVTCSRPSELPLRTLRAVDGDHLLVVHLVADADGVRAPRRPLTS